MSSIIILKQSAVLNIFMMYYMNIVSININLKVLYKYSNSVIDTL